MAPRGKSHAKRCAAEFVGCSLASTSPGTGVIEMHKLVLLRHGESVWNKENLFTGWMDVDLSEKGREEAKEAGLILREQGYRFDCKRQ